MAASLRQKAHLDQRVGVTNTTCIVEPCFTFVEHELKLYIAYLSASEDAPLYIQDFSSVSSESISGLFQQLKMWQNVIEYSLDESSNGFWGGFLEPVLRRLASLE